MTDASSSCDRKDAILPSVKNESIGEMQLDLPLLVPVPYLTLINFSWHKQSFNSPVTLE